MLDIGNNQGKNRKCAECRIHNTTEHMIRKVLVGNNKEDTGNIQRNVTHAGKFRMACCEIWILDNKQE